MTAARARATGSGSGRTRRVGYARVSATEGLDSQLAALRAAGCSEVFTDTAPGGERPEWDALLGSLEPGDTLVTTGLARVSRSLSHLLEVAAELERRGVELVCVRDELDTTRPSPGFFSFASALARMERELAAERAAAVARARGRGGGRPRTPRDKLERARRLYEGGKSAADAAREAGISRRTLFNHLAERRRKEAPARRPSRTSPTAPGGERADGPSSPSTVQLSRFEDGGHYFWGHYVIVPLDHGWAVIDYLDAAGEPIEVTGSYRGLVRTHGFGRTLACVRTLQDARRLLEGSPVERFFLAAGARKDGSAKLATLHPKRASAPAVYGWRHYTAERAPEGGWEIRAHWSLDGQPVDVVRHARRLRALAGGDSVEADVVDEHVTTVSSLREVREQLPRLFAKDREARQRRLVRLEADKQA